MPARPIWRGHLRLALVSCPVALWNARHDRSAVRFNMINPETGNRIKMVTTDAETGKELERRDVVKGYEFRKNEYLLLTDDDLNSVKVESSAVDDGREVRRLRIDRPGLAFNAPTRRRR
jgi:DNA end-binding protein Ku